MPRWKHNAANTSIERVKPINTYALTKPSSSSKAYKCSFPYEPSSAEGQAITVADVRDDLYYRTSTATTEGELSTSEYTDLGRQNADAVSIPGLHNMAFMPSGLTEQRIHDIKSDNTHIYVLWSEFSSGFYRLHISKINPDCTLQGSAEICTHQTTDFFQNINSGYHAGQTRTCRLVVPENPHSYLYAVVVVNDANNFSPGLAGGGTDNSITMFRFNKSDLLQPGGTDQWDIVASTSAALMGDIGVTDYASGNRIHIGYTLRLIAGPGPSGVGYSTFNYSTNSFTLGVVFKTAADNNDSYGMPTAVETSLGVRCLWSEYNDSAGTTTIYAADTDGANEDVIVQQGSTGMTYAMQFDVIVSILDNYFRVFYMAESDGGTTTSYYMKVCNPDGTGGGDELIKKHSSVRAGNIFAVWLDPSNNTDGYVVFSDHDGLNNAEYASFINSKLATVPNDGLFYRVPTLVAPPLARTYFPAYSPARGQSVMAISEANAGDGELWCVFPNYAALLIELDGDDDWHRSADQLVAAFMGGGGLLYETHPDDKQRGVRLIPFGSPAWIETDDSRGYTYAGFSGMEEGMGSAALVSPSWSIGPPDTAHIMVISNARGDMFDPALIQATFFNLTIEPDEESILQTNPSAMASDPQTVLSHIKYGLYDREAVQQEAVEAQYSETASRFAARGNGSDLITLLDGSNDVLSSVSLSVVGYDVVSVTAIAVNPQNNVWYCVMETSKYGSNVSFLVRVAPLTGEAVLVGRMLNGALDVKINDLTFDETGTLYAVADDTSPNNPHDVFTVSTLDGALTLGVSGTAGTNHVIQWNSDNNLLYHFFDNPPKGETVNPNAAWAKANLNSGSPLPQLNTPPDPAIAGITAALFDGSEFVVSDSANNVYTIDNAGTVLYDGAVSATYHGLDQRPSALPAARVDGSTIAAIAQPFYVQGHEAVKVSSVQLALEQNGNPSDIYDVKIVRYHSVQNSIDIPVDEDVMAEGTLDASTVSGALHAANVAMTHIKPLLPGCMYALVLSRQGKPKTFWTINNLNTSIQKNVLDTNDTIEEIEVSISGETILQLDGIAIDPSGNMYCVGISDADAAHSFLGTVDRDTGIITKIGTGVHLYNDITFDGGGQLVGVTYFSCPSDPDYVGYISLIDGTFTPVQALAVGSGSRACAFRAVDGLVYIQHRHSPFDKVDMGIPSLTNIGQSGSVFIAPAEIGGMVWDEDEDKFIVYESSNSARKKVNPAGAWEDYARSNKAPGGIAGYAFDVDSTAITSDAVNYIGAHKAGPKDDTTLAYKGRVKLAGEWYYIENPFSVAVLGTSYAPVVVEISRDGGTTWTELTERSTRKLVEDAWNGRDYISEDMGGYTDVSLQPSGSSIVQRMRIKGTNVEVRSIARFSHN